MNWLRTCGDVYVSSIGLFCQTSSDYEPERYATSQSARASSAIISGISSGKNSFAPTILRTPREYDYSVRIPISNVLLPMTTAPLTGQRKAWHDRVADELETLLVPTLTHAGEVQRNRSVGLAAIE